MKLHSNKAKGEDASPGDAEAESTRVPDGAQISPCHPPPSTQDVPMSPESRDQSTPRSRFHHTFDSSFDYSTHRSQPLLDPLLLQRGSYRSQSSQYPCGQTAHTFAQNPRTFPSTSPFQKSIVNGWYTCHSGVDSFPPKQCNNIPSLWAPVGTHVDEPHCFLIPVITWPFQLFLCPSVSVWPLYQISCDTSWVIILKCGELSLLSWGLSGWSVARALYLTPPPPPPQWLIGTFTTCVTVRCVALSIKSIYLEWYFSKKNEGRI